ncbi:hypothetical protein CY34DRAFT_799301 [Suillus luteus UH-Slu-Lm8-n1]|uniref:Uncharacterized protein n=1 Tax=Suillus luteus UH-Slu-Lm8-n1 TaxID=930992 RepID=A0A0D0ABB4_9AGAM|nr:hypothetical protein CY34DRAFT_799301 [Suillus luteus UH-Slu-Lm8-n1]
MKDRCGGRGLDITVDHAPSMSDPQRKICASGTICESLCRRKMGKKTHGSEQSGCLIFHKFVWYP